MEETASQSQEIPPPPSMSPEATKIQSSPSAASVIIKSKASSPSTISLRRSEQNMRAKRRSGFGTTSTRGRSLGSRHSATSFLSPTAVSSSSSRNPPPQPSFKIGYLGLSPGMQSRQHTTSPSRGAFVEPLTPTQQQSLHVPKCRIVKSRSLQQVQQKALLSASSRKQVGARSISFSGRPNAKFQQNAAGGDNNKQERISLTWRAQSDSDSNSSRPPRQHVSQRKRSSKERSSKILDRALQQTTFLTTTPTPPRTPVSVTVAREEQQQDIVTNTKSSCTTPPRKVHFHDKIRFKGISHSRVDPETIWYSKAEIMAHRKREEEVKDQFQECGNSTILNVEGLVTEKDRRLMQERRTESREAVFDIQDVNHKQNEHESSSATSSPGESSSSDDQHEAMAEDYGRIAAPAAQSAVARATRLAYHVNLLWDPVFGYHANIHHCSRLSKEKEQAANDIIAPPIGASQITHPMEHLNMHRMEIPSISYSESQGAEIVHPEPNQNFNVKLVRKADVKSWLGNNGEAPRLPERRSFGHNNVAIRRYRVTEKVSR